MNDRTNHINYQNACRCLYHGWSSNSVDSPMEFLCIIHDKMDHTKFAIPRMQRSTKATCGLGQIPISNTEMLMHGHGNGAYAHYSTTFWPGDSNFTISSICRVLRALEQHPVQDSKESFIVPPQNSFFEMLLHGKSRCSASILPNSANMMPPPFPGRPVVSLPKKLFLQLENSAKDNKNLYVMAFCLLLTAKRVFKEVTIEFLIVGHTHKDIDAHFSYVLKLLKMKNTYVLSNLMKAFMDFQKTTAFIPKLAQEVADFKKFSMAINMMVRISSLDLEKCISLSSMLRRKATIWASQVRSQILHISIYPFFEWKYISVNSMALSLCGCRRGIHLYERRVESGERRAVVGEWKIDYSVVIFLEKEPLKPWKSRRLGSKFSFKLTKKTPKPWNMPSKIVR